MGPTPPLDVSNSCGHKRSQAAGSEDAEAEGNIWGQRSILQMKHQRPGEYSPCLTIGLLKSLRQPGSAWGCSSGTNSAPSWFFNKETPLSLGSAGCRARPPVHRPPEVEVQGAAP